MTPSPRLADPESGRSRDDPRPASFGSVTELPGGMASAEQLSMLQTRYRLARDLAEGGDVLEVACGSGIGLGFLATKARRVVGVDYDPTLVEAARRHYGTRLVVDVMDAERLEFPTESFDAVLLLEAIYYLPSAERFVREAYRVLRPGGHLLVVSVNREWDGFNPSPFSRRYFSAGELLGLLKGSGFEARTLVGFPDDRRGLRPMALSALRRLAVRLRLIPKSMNGKTFLKRLVFGKLLPLPAELAEGTGVRSPLTPADAEVRPGRCKVLYAIGVKR